MYVSQAETSSPSHAILVRSLCYLSEQPVAMSGHALQSVESSYRVLIPWPKSAKVNLHFLQHNLDKGSCMQAGLLLLVHGEVTDPSVDFFDREKVFIEQKLKPIMDKCLS